jgi:hypothetical protein
MANHSYQTHIYNVFVSIDHNIYKDIFLTSIGQVKTQYFATTNMLVTKLDQHFANSKLMNALGIVYS